MQGSDRVKEGRLNFWVLSTILIRDISPKSSRQRQYWLADAIHDDYVLHSTPSPNGHRKSVLKWLVTGLPRYEPVALILVGTEDSFEACLDIKPYPRNIRQQVVAGPGPLSKQ